MRKGTLTSKTCRHKKKKKSVATNPNHVSYLWCYSWWLRWLLVSLAQCKIWKSFWTTRKWLNYWDAEDIIWNQKSCFRLLTGPLTDRSFVHFPQSPLILKFYKKWHIIITRIFALNLFTYPVLLVLIYVCVHLAAYNFIHYHKDLFCCPFIIKPTFLGPSPITKLFSISKFCHF